MSKTDAFENDLLLLIFNTTTIANIADDAAASPATTLEVALHSTPGVGEAGIMTTNEIVYTGYARVTVARSGAGWSVSGNSVSPVANIDFPPCTGLTDTATHFSVGSGVTNDVMYHGTVTPNIAIADGVTPRLTTASAITED